MNEVELIIHQLKTTFDGTAWHGPSLMDTLREVDADEARRRPIEGRHPIWEIVTHCAYWMNAVAGALKGEGMPSIELGSEKDWPQMGETERGWTAAVEGLRKSHDGIVDALASFECSRLGGAVPGRSYTYRKMLHGIADHNLYHAGQIAVLRRKR
ncbi:MAG: DinB family protein [Candidatus Bathyarchaeia archaeon]